MEQLVRKMNPIYQFWRVWWAFCGTTGLLALLIGFFSLNTGLRGLTPPLCYASAAFLSMMVLPLYTFPSYWAYRHQKSKKRRLLWINVLLGWTLIGYIFCLLAAADDK